MTSVSTPTWSEANRSYLAMRLAHVRERVSGPPAAAESEPDVQAAMRGAAFEEAARQIAEGMTSPPALDAVCAAFDLSTFERDILVMCAAVEIDPEFRRLCAAAQPNAQLSYPTFNLAMASLDDPHWSALTPSGPLRRWRLIEAAAGDTLMTSVLRIDERTLHYLVGTSYLDERLHGLIEPVAPATRLPASYRVPAEHIVDVWGGREQDRPVVHLCGDIVADKRLLASAACLALGLQLHALRASDVPPAPAEREALVRLWQRESALIRSALFVDCEDCDPAAIRHAQAFVERLGGMVFVAGGSWTSTGRISCVRLDLSRPPADEQRALWQAALGPLADRLNGQLDAIVGHFRLDADAIQSVSRRVGEMAAADAASAGPALWDHCRALARTPLGGLADRIEARACWEDLVLPDEQQQTLREIVAHVRQRGKVYESWGFAGHGVRGLGISALFCGPTGTGKTLAAEVLANELRLDLYRIDLSQIVSKYIGETEKSLRRVFDAAEHSGAVLLFDEADALFGKRSEVHDSHDRYANIEVSYLLQRMESYRGLAVLTTNRRGALDAAFLRRLRFVVTFPFPDAAQRARIWRRIFPATTPTDGLDVDKLARLNVAGGNIRNIALNAAFLAADLGEPVRMSHLLRTACSECMKLEKSATVAEIGGWV
jgi:hypothetical protein